MKHVICTNKPVFSACLLLSCLFVLQAPGNTPTTYSHRLIVEFEKAPLAAAASFQTAGRTVSGRLRTDTPAAQEYVNAIQQEQERMLRRITGEVPGLSVSKRMNRSGKLLNNACRIVLNAVAVDAGNVNIQDAIQTIQHIPGVKKVYRDRRYVPHLYASRPQIGAFTIWSNTVIGSMTNAGRGIKCASVDGGLYNACPMFSGNTFDYPTNYPPGGYGQTVNNNGKIIVSRAYFRPWDPPVPSSTNAWPGPQDISHGVHTAGIMCGNPVTADYINISTEISGVAPGAWAMSYKVFYESVTGDRSVYSVEAIAALEDVVKDGADVVNNSWGSASMGTVNDPTEAALVNCAKAGVFVVTSAGNSGPAQGTLDHISPEVVTVASLTTTSHIDAGFLRITGSGSIPSNLQHIAYTTADFGPVIPNGTALTNTYLASALLNPANIEGCSAWPTGTFNREIALIKRGSCDFSDKVYKAQQAGAELVMIYNHESGGDQLMDMGAGDNAELVTIPSIFIGNTDGNALINWASNTAPAQVEVVAEAFMVANMANVIADNSSRGPGVLYTLKPDIAAPGVNILSQGYAPGKTNMAQYVGYGQAGGTSMAAPQIAGAGALLLQIHPDWSPAQVKSALMTSSRYLDIYSDTNGTPAQPLDMGAGALDLSKAADPGLILDPPSLSFGLMASGSTRTLSVELTSVGNQTETYSISTLCSTSGYSHLDSLAGLTVFPDSVTLAPNQSTTITASWATAGLSPGNHQGYIILSGSVHHAHAPVWSLVAATPQKDVLLIDSDGSFSNPGGKPDYRHYYTGALSTLGLSYDVYDADENGRFPAPAYLANYPMAVLFTGDSWDEMAGQEHLREYVNGGGRLLAMGNYFYYQIDGSFEEDIMGIFIHTNSVTGQGRPSHAVQPAPSAPPAFSNLLISVTSDGDGASNQTWMAELYAEPWTTNGFAPGEVYPFFPLLAYTGGTETAEGIVSIGHRAQPSLAWPEPAFVARTLYTCFGLEGVNDAGTPYTDRANTLQHLMNWLNDSPDGSINVTVDYTNSITFTAILTSGAGTPEADSTRWDFGDGTTIVTSMTAQAAHTYSSNGYFTCRAEVRDTWGNRCVISRIVPVGKKKSVLDFDGDGVSDLAVYYLAAGNWYVEYSGGGTLQGANWGWNGAIPVTGDYDGDGLNDLAVYGTTAPYEGNWYIKYSGSSTIQVENWGWNGAVPVPGDYDGDGLNDLAVYGIVAPYEGTWYVKYSSDDSIHINNWGWSGAMPVPGDYDGDGRDDLAVYGIVAPYEGTWYVKYSSDDNIHINNWGWSGAKPVPGDYDGDGLTDRAVYGNVPPYEGNWYIQYSGGGIVNGWNWGWNGAVPVVGDYDGDGQSDYCVYGITAPYEGNWYIQYSGGGILNGFNWGWNSALPLGRQYWLNILFF